MPTVTLDKKTVLKLLGKKVSDKELLERIPMLGTDLDKVTEKEIEVEIFPNRPDMLSDEGFARAFSSFLGIKTGLRKYDIKRSGEKVVVDKNVQKIWPYVVTAIVRNLKFDDAKIKTVIQAQEKLGATVLRERKKGGIGIYPLEHIKFPITFKAESLDKIKFRPLEFPRELTGRQILSQHPTGRKYCSVLESSSYPVFVDASGKILSMPPIINSHDMGKITEETKDIFVEATGIDLNVLKKIINIFASMFAEMGGQVYSMDITYPASYKEKKITTPDLNPDLMKLDVDYANKILGLELKTADAAKLLEKMGYGIKSKTGKDVFVLIPAYRTDILHPIDLVEDIAIAYGYDIFEPEIPNISTTGQENPKEALALKIANLMTGLNAREVSNYLLTNKETQNTKMSQENKLVSLASAVNAEYDVLRANILPQLVKVLSENTGEEYPQNIFEIGNVFSFGKTETGVEEKQSLAFATARLNANFTMAKQVLQSLTKSLDKRFEVKEKEHTSFVPGRAGAVFVDGIEVGIIGELHPQVLVSFGIKVPVVGFEIDV